MTLRWAVVDAWTIAQRTMNHWVRQPGAFAIGLLFPLMVLVMFAYLFGGALAVPGGGDYKEFLVPGMLGLTVLFGVETTMTAVVDDAAKGVTDRLRSMPMSGSAIVTGRGIADMLNSALGLMLLAACGLLVGWRFHEGVANAVLALGLLLLLRTALVWVGVWLGLLVKSPEAIIGVQILVWPVGMLSSAFVAPETMPDALAVLAEVNPLSATVTAIRDLFGNPGHGGGTTWFADHAMLMAVVWPLVITAVFLPLAVRRYRALR